MLRERVPKSNGTCKKIQVVITSGMWAMVRQGMLFSSKCVYRNKICFAGMSTKPFAILYIIYSLASFLWSDRNLHPNGWRLSVTLEVLWLRCRTYRAARRWIISSLSV